jgi:cell division protein FtsI/penicillin-binding protein 2
MLTGVIEEGTGKMAQVPGFSSAGKTGTAQKLEPNGTYSHSKFVASFIGFAPVEDPIIAIAVVVDEPHPYYFGGVVSAPVFRNVAADVLRYLKTQSNELLTLNAD